MNDKSDRPEAGRDAAANGDQPTGEQSATVVMLRELAGRTALITGASSGLGAEFARRLAAAGCNLILVARRADRLQALKDEIIAATAANAVSVDVIVMDLVTRNAAQSLYDEISSWNREVDVVINNAGVGLFGWCLDLDWQRQADMLQLDVAVPLELAHRFGRDMRARGRGHILFVSSVAGYAATPTYAAYAGAKAAVLLFGEALNFELRGSGVTSTVLSPGITRTEFLDVSGQSPTLFQRLAMMQADTVADAGLIAMVRGKASVIPGLHNKILIFGTRAMPRAWVKWVSYFLMRNKQVT